jgi:hypothetical protein
LRLGSAALSAGLLGIVLALLPAAGAGASLSAQTAGGGTSLTINTVDTTNSVVVSVAADGAMGVAVTLESDGIRTVVEFDGSVSGLTAGGAGWRPCNRAILLAAVACAVARRGATGMELVELVRHAQPGTSRGSRHSVGTTITLVSVPS